MAKTGNLGVRWLFTGGSPFTPYNVQQTVLRENWDVRPYGVPDYDQLNTQRISAFHQLDIRIDKKYFFKRWSLDVYFDVQNAYNQVTNFQDNIDVQRDANGQPIVNPADPNYYLPKYIQNTYGQLLTNNWSYHRALKDFQISFLYRKLKSIILLYEKQIHFLRYLVPILH